MITSQKSLHFTFKSILLRAFLSNFSQNKILQPKKHIKTPFFLISEQSSNPLTTNIGYGITQLKNAN